MAYIFYEETVLGLLGVREEDEAVTHVYFGIQPSGAEEKKTPLIERTFLQLEEYFSGKRQVFDLPLAPKGTAFQKRVWQALMEIPYGQLRTYRQIAENVQNEKACRAVGLANNRNPIPIIIPCHRVVGSNGRLVGYAGGLDIKKKLLNIEAVE